jgi:hypothetical protein
MADCCGVCGERIRRDEYEAPPGSGVVYARNPNTFRLSWIHDYCYSEAWEEAKVTPSKHRRYQSRLDEMLSRYP